MLLQRGLLVSLFLWQACTAVLAGGVARRQGVEWQPYKPQVATHAGWQIRSFLEDAGLMGRFVFCVDFDSEGNVWVASGEGLYFYDGYTWTRFSQSDGLPSDFVRCVRVARDGRVWVGTDMGIATLDAQKRISIPENAGLAGPNVRRIVEDYDGTLWFCSDTWLTPKAPSGLAALREGEWTVYRKEDGLPSDYVSNYFRDSAGRQFVLSRDGLGVRESGSWTKPLEAAGLPGYDQYFWSIAETPSLGVLVSVEDAVFVLKNKQWSRIEYDRSDFAHLKLTTVRSGEVITFAGEYDGPKYFHHWTGSSFVCASGPIHVPGEATYLAEAPDGSVWAVGYDMLLRWSRSGGEWTEYADILAPRLVDSEERVWFVADRTILRLTGEDEWESFPYAVRTIARGLDEEVLAFAESSVFRFVSDEVIAYGPEQTGVGRIFGHVLDVRGQLWLHGLGSSGRNVISVFDGVSWKAKVPPEIQEGGFRASVPDPTGGVYYLIADESDRYPRLIHVSGDGIEMIALPVVTTGATHGFHVDHRGCPWFYGQFGLHRFDGGVWQRVEGIPGGRVSRAMSAEGETWFTYDGAAGGRTGLGCLRDGVWSYFDLDKRPRLCGLDAKSGLFFTTTGVLHSVQDGLRDGFTPVMLPVEQAIYNVVRGPTGDLWVGLGDSVLRYRPDGVPPQTLIADVEDEAQEGDALAATFHGVERFKPQGEGPLTYSWRINAGQWSEFGPAPAQGIPISLSPGPYTLEVRARDEGLDIDPTPARAEFSVVAIPWTERPWFWHVAGAVVTALVLLGAAAVIARHRAQFHAVRLEELVEERTAKLRESEARFRAMTAAAPLPIVITREFDGVILYANPLMGETLGVPSSELLGRRAQEFFDGSSARRRMLVEVRKMGFSQGCEILTQRADGTPLWCLVSLQKMVYEGAPALIGGFHDITERKHTAEELERARAAAEIASRAKSVLLANLTHEVRTPVMAMLGAAEASATSTANAGDDMDYVDVISRNGRYLLSLFDDLLDVARLEAGKFAVSPVRCSLLDILADVRSVAHLPCQAPGVDFKLFCEGPIPYEITTDPLRLKQALINLVNNALKFTSEGHVHVRVCVHLESDGSWLLIDVEDTGPGIPETERGRIFDAFEQVERQPGRPSVGVGLGLPLARSIVEELGGTLALQSQVGRGSTFTLRLPTGPVGAVEWGTPGEIDVSQESFIGDSHSAVQDRLEGSVLLAEDSPDARALIAHALEAAGASVTAVENGQEAVEAATEQVYDLILMDIRMPIMDGVAATVELRRRRYLAPIIALTASVAEDNRRQVLENGFDDLWDKPMSLWRIVERASDYLRSASTGAGGKPAGKPKPGSASLNDARRASLVAEFANSLPAQFQAIRTAVDKGDFQDAREVLHRLAGTGGMMGFMPVSEEAGRILSRIKAGTYTGAEYELGALEDLVNKIAVCAADNAAPSTGDDQCQSPLPNVDPPPTCGS